MELRDLKYFLAIARHGNLSEAADSLHLTQPALTRSLKHLEEELGKQLVIRGSRKTALTDDGRLLQRRAEELLLMAEKTILEISTPGDVIEGNISICAGETKALHFLTQAARRLIDKYPDVHINISSGDAVHVLYELENGLSDFGLLFPPIDHDKYASLRIPYPDTWGFVIRKDTSLAEKPYLTAQDVAGQPLIVPRGLSKNGRLAQLLHLPEKEIKVAATYSLIFNGTLMVTDGIGILLGLDNILNLTGKTVNCFRPLHPLANEYVHICWKKYAPMTRQAATLLEEMRAPESIQTQYLFEP